jgi:hypothetical protein
MDKASRSFRSASWRHDAAFVSREFVMSNFSQNASEQSEVIAREIEAAIESWFVETIHNSPVSRATEIFNHVRVAVDVLKKRLAALLQEQ